jgi:hypothetical protein
MNHSKVETNQQNSPAVNNNYMYSYAVMSYHYATGISAVLISLNGIDDRPLQLVLTLSWTLSIVPHSAAGNQVAGVVSATNLR